MAIFMTTSTITKSRISIRDIVLCGLFAALISVGAFIKIPIGIVPMTLQTLFVTLATFTIGSRRAFIATSVYIAIGLLGFPVFTQGGGITYVLQPTFGYLLGYAIAAFVMGYIIEHSTKKGVLAHIAAIVIGMSIVYLLGMAYFYLISNIYLGKGIPITTILVSCCAVFIPTDVLSCCIAALIGGRIPKSVIGK